MEVVIDGITYVPVTKNQYISLWFMHDNHTFSRIEGRTIEEIAKHGYELGKEHSYGMLCQPRIVTVREGERNREQNVGITVHHSPRKDDYDWVSEVAKWKQAIEASPDAMKLIQEGKINL
jgi:hypothetical protein